MCEDNFTFSTLCYRDGGYDMCELTVVGKAFLWHQIRCIVAVLLLVGQDREKPEVSHLYILCHISFIQCMHYLGLCSFYITECSGTVIECRTLN